MTEAQTALSRRAVACKGWRWIGGMRYRLHPTHPHFRFDGEYCSDGTPVPQAREAIPDLTDPATLGCILALVRRAWSDECAYLAPADGWFVGAGSRASVLAEGATEAEALVAALEGAP